METIKSFSSGPSANGVSDNSNHYWNEDTTLTASVLLSKNRKMYKNDYHYLDKGPKEMDAFGVMGDPAA